MAASSRRLIYPAIGIYALGTYGAVLFFRSQQSGGEAESKPARTWDEIADGYDGELGRDETVMGMKLCRWWLIRQAKGDVLEVSAGTGRNLPYYRINQLSSLTLTDTSKYMLWHASQKWRNKQAAKAVQLPVSFFLSDAEHLAAAPAQPGAAGEQAEQQPGLQRRMQLEEKPEQAATERGTAEDPLPAPVSSIFASKTGGFAESSFDSVVDTFGLCSHSDPVAVLMEMARVCKPDGRILLLEHGRAGWDWLNGVLDRGERKHLRKWGCQWNRDIETIVAQAGLEVESISRWHFGTTYIVVARPGTK